MYKHMDFGISKFLKSYMRDKVTWKSKMCVVEGVEWVLGVDLSTGQFVLVSCWVLTNAGNFSLHPSMTR